MPLLQSTKSQMSIGVGEGDIVKTIEDENDSQNIPANPSSHSQKTVPLPRSIHSPLLQLIKSHIETLTVGVGEMKMDVGDTLGLASVISDVVGDSERLSAVEVGAIDVVRGSRRLSELVKTNMTGEEVKATGEMKEDVGRRMSQNSPVHPMKH